MNKIFTILAIFFSFLMFGMIWINTTSAHVDIKTYILDNHNDLWLVTPKWSYYTAKIPFTDGNAVRDQFISQLSYPWDFYYSRNINERLLRNESPYFTVEWHKPVVAKSLEGIRKILRGYLFAYRRDWNIFWTDAKHFTPAYLSGYESPHNQNIIIYPIKDKKTKKTVAFLQYPCWNLVCKDTQCSDLNVKPVCWDGIVSPEVGEQCDPRDPNTSKGCSNTCKYQELVCKVVVNKENIDDKTRPSVKIQAQNNVSIKEIFVNRDRFNSVVDINKKLFEPGEYHINVKATNNFSWKEFLCESWTFRVNEKQYCWNGKVDWNEECDYADPNNNGSCNKQCKFTDVSCSVSVKLKKVQEPTPINNLLTIKKAKNTEISSILLNGKDITNTNPTLDTDWKHTVQVNVRNAQSGKSATCEASLTYDKKEFCWDGVKNGYEQCDDWNNEDGDWCSKTCKLENPYCKITKSNGKINEWDKFQNFVNFSFKGKFETAVLNNEQVFNSVEELLNNTVPHNKCNTNSVLSYTVSNPIDPSKTKTCTVSFKTYNREYCWDGKVQKTEQCDPKDPYSWIFCTETCEFKSSTQCHIMNNTFNVNDDAAIVLDTEYFVIPSKLSINGKNISAKNGIFKFKFKTPWTYKATALLQNKADTRNLKPSYCQFDIIVNEDKCKIDKWYTNSSINNKTHRNPISKWLNNYGFQR